MKGYQAIYVCRLCGEKYNKNTEYSVYLAGIEVKHACRGNPIERESLWLHEVHNCKDGSIGVGDFQGYQYKEN